MKVYRFLNRKDAMKELGCWTNPINKQYFEACLLIEKEAGKTYYTVLVDKR